MVARASWLVPSLVWFGVGRGRTVAGAAVQECFCQYAEDPLAAAENGSNATSYPEMWELTPEVFVPEWRCVSGLRQYQCIRKTRRGRTVVVRGVALERPAPAAYCNGSKLVDPCEALPQMGFSVSGGSLGAVANLQIQITCPAAVNCSNASAFLSAEMGIPCEDGLFRNLTSEDLHWVTTAPSQTIQSPTTFPWSSVVLEPFAYSLDIDNDTLMTVSPWRHTVQVFMKSGTTWDAIPTAEYRYDNESMFTQPAQWFNTRPVAMSADAMLTQFRHNPALSASAGVFAQAVWEALGQRMIIFPRGARWGTEPAITLTGMVDKAGFGISADTSGGYAIVGSEHNQRRNATAGTAQIFERSAGGVWTTTPSVVIGVGYEAITSFGRLVAIDAGFALLGPATALVSGPSAGRVYVFVRGSGGWSTTATATLYRDAGNVAFPAGYGYPSSLAIHGGYAVISGSERMWIYTRRAGLWTDAPVQFAGVVAAGGLFANSVAVVDLGSGRAVVACGAVNAKRAFLFDRDTVTGSWVQEELSVGSSYMYNPAGFGRAVGVGEDSVIIASDEKKIFVFTKDTAGMAARTNAEPLQVAGRTVFDGRFLQVGAQHKVCLNFGMNDPAFPNNTFQDVGLRLYITWGPRSEL